MVNVEELHFNFGQNFPFFSERERPREKTREIREVRGIVPGGNFRVSFVRSR